MRDELAEKIVDRVNLLGEQEAKDILADVAVRLIEDWGDDGEDVGRELTRLFVREHEYDLIHAAEGDDEEDED